MPITYRRRQKTRYRCLAKISIIDGIDPLSDGVFGEEVDVTPPVEARGPQQAINLVDSCINLCKS